MFGWFAGRRKGNRGQLVRAQSFDRVVDKGVIKEETKKLWDCVSLSRSQFKDHYVGTIRNVAVYMQDKEAFSEALKNAASALQGTMMIRLPRDRSREEGAQVEQLWKYAMFLSHLLREASKVNRSWYDSNLNKLLPVSSSLWLLDDDEKCLYEVSRAVNGNVCFIDSSAEDVITPEKQDENDSSLEQIKNKIVSSSRDSKSKQDATGDIGVVRQHNLFEGMNESDESVGVVDSAKTVVRIGSTGNSRVVKTPGRSVENTGKKPKVKKQSKLIGKQRESTAHNKEGVGESVGVKKTKKSDIKDDVKIPSDSSESVFDIADFERWIETNANWEYTETGGKAFPYQSTLQKYINRKKLSLKASQLLAILKKTGYQRIELDNALCVSLPENERV